MKRITGLFCAALLALLLSAAPLPALAAESGTVAEGQYVFDAAGRLSAPEVMALNAAARRVSERYGCGFYAALLEDYAEYGTSVESAAQTVYTMLELGYGQEESGILLLLSMDGRDYDLCARGYGNTAFTDYGKTVIAQEFRDDFRYDDWAAGLKDYISVCGELLDYAERGMPVDVSAGNAAPRSLREAIGLPGIFGIAIVTGCLAALIVCSAAKGKMKSVRAAGEAEDYLVPGSLELYQQADSFSHVTETRVQVESDADRDGGGGGGTSVNSDGFSHSSGKF